MAERPAPNRRVGAQPPTDPPLVDLIFPNRDQSSGQRRTTTHLDQMMTYGRHRRKSRLRRVLSRGRSSAPAIGYRASDHPIRRRRLLLGLGTGVIAASGVGTAASLLTGAMTPALSGGGGRTRRPNTAVDGLGAAGLADSPSEAARIAAQATPTWPTPLSRDPHLHLLRRATFGPTLVDVVAVQQMGIDAWIERQLNPSAIPDPAEEEILKIFPTVGMTTAQIRKTVKEFDWQAMWELGRATLARQMWSSRQLLEVMVDFWSNHLHVTNPFDGG